MQPFTIPQHWNVQQAIEVTDFLAEVIEAIWDTHGDRMAQHLQAIAADEHVMELHHRHNDDDLDDEIPF